MALTTEILFIETTEAFRNNPGIATPAFDIVLTTQGVHGPGYYGTQIENPSAGYFFLAWDNYEAHKAVMDSGELYTSIAAVLKPSLGSKPEMYHVIFSGPTIALQKPVTEVLVLTLKAPENRAAVVDILSKISEASGKMLVFGQTREDENKYIVICGWESVEAHWETAAKPEIAATIDKLHSLTNEDHLYHTKLSQHPL